MSTTTRLLTMSAAILMGLGSANGASLAFDGHTKERTDDSVSATVAKTIAIDSSSEDSFRLSLKAMRAALTPEDRKSLGLALKKLSGGTGALSAAGDGKPAMYGSTRIAALYETLGDRLNGKTFDEIIAMAN